MNFQKFYLGDKQDLEYIIAFDPGQTTGWCVLGVLPSVLKHDDEQKSAMSLPHRIAHADYGQIVSGPGLIQENTGIDDMLNIVQDYTQFSSYYPHIVVEDFIINFKKIDQARHTLAPVRITAGFLYGLQGMNFDVEQVALRLPAVAKTYATDTRLRKWELFDSHSGPHARDATRHAYTHLVSLRDKSKSENNKAKATKVSQGERIPWLK
jgi:hypothetical protein